MDHKSQILDEVLVWQAQRGDEEAFGHLVIKWNKKLIYQSHIRTQDWQQSEDIVQDVWHWVVKNMTRLKEVDQFGAWIRTIVDRRSIDWVRRQQRKRIQAEKFNRLGDHEIQEEAYETVKLLEENRNQSLSDLERAIAQLNPESKLVLTLYYSESSSIETIAGILNIPGGTVKSRLYHAREKLKHILNKKGHEKSQ